MFLKVISVRRFRWLLRILLSFFVGVILPEGAVLAQLVLVAEVRTHRVSRFEHTSSPSSRPRHSAQRLAERHAAPFHIFLVGKNS